MSRKSIAVFVLVVVFVLTLLEGFSLFRAAALVIGASGMTGPWPDRIRSWSQQPHYSKDDSIPSRHGPVRCRVYKPARNISQAVLLTPGVHALGIDEPRLVRFASNLAAGGVAVVTPELPDLLEYRITPRLVDIIEDSAAWTISQPGIVPDGDFGMVGISFSGGLSVVAAGRPRIREKVRFAVTFGGQGDFPRVLRYLCTGVEPDGTHRAPHDYGLAVIVLNVAEHLVPADQVAPLRAGVRLFLKASHAAVSDGKAGMAILAQARAAEAMLPEPAATILKDVNTRNVEALGPLLLPVISAAGGDPALSPERSPAPACPVYLLHGEDDNVIPAVESRRLATYLARSTATHVLITPLVTHAEVDRETGAMDAFRLVRFWEQVLSE